MPIYIPSTDSNSVDDQTTHYIVSTLSRQEMQFLILEAAKKLRPELEYESRDTEETDEDYASIVFSGYRDGGFLRHKSEGWLIDVAFAKFPEFNVYAIDLDSMHDVALYVSIRRQLKK